jgi:hypothetical protein
MRYKFPSFVANQAASMRGVKGGSFPNTKKTHCSLQNYSNQLPSFYKE